MSTNVPNPRRQQAFELYMHQNKTQREIAQIIGVSERTIYTWIHQQSWQQLRQAALQGPAIVAENLTSALVELQNNIARREPGMRFPTTEESLVISRLVNAIDKHRKTPSRATTMQVLQTFRAKVARYNPEFASQLGMHLRIYFDGDSHRGYHPYQIEYGVEQVSPISPFYDDFPGGDEPALQPDFQETAEVTIPEVVNENVAQLTDFQSISPTSDALGQPEVVGSSRKQQAAEVDDESELSEPFPWSDLARSLRESGTDTSPGLAA